MCIPQQQSCCENDQLVHEHMRRNCDMPQRTPVHCLPYGHMMSPPRRAGREGGREGREGVREGGSE